MEKGKNTDSSQNKKPDMKELFRKRLKKRMQHLGMTQKELAEKSGTSEYMISAYLHGQKNSDGVHVLKTPSLDKLKRLADALSCSLDYFVNDSMASTPEKQTICDTYGLSDKALDMLQMFKGKDGKTGTGKQSIDSLNFLLERYFDAYTTGKGSGSTAYCTVFPELENYLRTDQQRVYAEDESGEMIRSKNLSVAYMDAGEEKISMPVSVPDMAREYILLRRIKPSLDVILDTPKKAKRSKPRTKRG